MFHVCFPLMSLAGNIGLRAAAFNRAGVEE
jgi:hypothetical protein